jgi:uncharacterized protein (DUF1778 family)
VSLESEDVMVRKSDSKAAETVQELEQKDTVTFSVRFTEEQRALINAAAELRGWTPTNLLRVAALEKAAHIVNTSTRTRVDFKDLAATVATQIFAIRSCRVPYKDEFTEADVFEDFSQVPDLNAYVYPVEISPWQMPPTFLDKLKEAARFGGTEFLGLILQSSEDITSRIQPDLPDPVDPGAI